MHIYFSTFSPVTTQTQERSHTVVKYITSLWMSHEQEQAHTCTYTACKNQAKVEFKSRSYFSL